MRITNPAARELAYELRKLCGLFNPDNEDYLRGRAKASLGEYRRWLAPRLRELKFFSMLNEELEFPMLEAEEHTALQQLYAKHFPPRSMRARAYALATQLDVMLGLGEEAAKKSRRSIANAWSFGILLVLTFALLVTFALLQRPDKWIWMGVVAMNLVTSSLMLSRMLTRPGQQFDPKSLVNAAELYRYLVELHTAEQAE